MCVSGLSKRLYATYTTIRAGAQESPGGLLPLELARRLRPREHRSYRLLDQFARCVTQGSEPLLPSAEARQLAALAHEVALWARGRLREHALGVASAPRPARHLLQRDAASLRDEVRENLRDSMHGLVQDLRRALKTTCDDCGCERETVTRGRYRVVRESSFGASRPGALDSGSDGAHRARQVDRRLGALHRLFCRPDWLEPAGYWLTNSFWLAQSVLRCALATGLITTDDGRYLGQSIPMHEIEDARVRSILQRVAHASWRTQQVFELFYAPDRGTAQRGWSMRPWARPHAAGVVLFLNAARNRVLQCVNHLFVPCGHEPYPLIAGCELFPNHDDWIPAGSIPSAPVLWDDSELGRRCDALCRIGLRHTAMHLPGPPPAPRSREIRPEAPPASPPPVRAPEDGEPGMRHHPKLPTD